MSLINTIISIDAKTPQDYLRIISEKVRDRRLDLDLTQEGLASRAGVKLPTYRKFEQKGEISLLALLKIAWALDMLDDFNLLFAEKQYRSIEEMLSQQNITRKRGKRR